MVRDSFSVIFYLRNNDSDKNGEAPIYLRITVDGRRSECSVQRKISPELWNSRFGRVRGSNSLSKELNRYLEEIQSKVYSIQARMATDGKNYTASLLKSVFLGQDQQHKMVLELYQEHNDEICDLVGTEYSQGAYQRHVRTQRHLKAFIKKEYKQEDLPLREVDLRFIKRFEHFLKTLKLGGQNNVTKYITSFKKIIRIAFAHNWIQKDPFFHWKATWKPVIREALTETEMNTLMEKDFKIARLTQVKDIFLFSCFTGLAYADVKKLSSEHIVIGMDGEKWIKTRRSKTQTRSSVPLLPMAEELLKKYKDHSEQTQSPYLLPVITNQKMNAYLKEIADICKIRKRLTFHLARHTFATTVTLTNGVPIESVSRMLGHRSLRTTQIYAKVVDTKLREDMKKIRNKYTRSHLRVIRNDDPNGTEY